MELVRPAFEHLPSYVAALEAGWSPSTINPKERAAHLAAIAEDAAGFLARQDDRLAAGGRVTLPDGSTVARLPGYRRWMWDGEFCGNIGLRWQPGTPDLPPHVLGHVGYGVVAWKQRRGYASRALALICGEARALGLPWIDVCTQPDNMGSQKVIAANGGRFIERFVTLPAFGGTEEWRYRIEL